MTVKRILVPVDFSEHSARAVGWAKMLAGTTGASLDLLTVVPDPFTLPNPGPLYVPLPSDYREGLRQDAERHIKDVLSAAETAQYRARCAVLFGDAAREILDYVGRESIDLIVMGTHGRGGLARVMMGSVAEKTVRTAPCPVLTVR